MRARFGRSGGRSGGKRRTWCAKHERWHGIHAAAHCAGKRCERLEKTGTCPAVARVIPPAARRKLTWLLR